MPYDCITCGPLNKEYHDGRDGTPCLDDCIPSGQCEHRRTPAVKDNNGQCYWARANGHMNAWYMPDPDHRERTEEDGPAPAKPEVGQMGFDGSIFGYPESKH